MNDPTDRIKELRVFVAVADLRGFAQAARRLGDVPLQRTSKLIARVEDRLNFRLLRTTRDISLTDKHPA